MKGKQHEKNKWLQLTNLRFVKKDMCFRLIVETSSQFSIAAYYGVQKPGLRHANRRLKIFAVRNFIIYIFNFFSS